MKLTPLLSALMALTLCSAPLLPVKAEPTSVAGMKIERVGKKLNLTDAQKMEWQRIQKATSDRLNSILSNEQKAQLEAAKAKGEKKPWKSLNLTEEQKQQMRAIRKEAREQRLAILTPEQKQIFEQMPKNRMGRKQMVNN